MITIHDVQSRDSIIDDLAWPFDFDVARSIRDSSWIILTPPVDFEVIAGDSTGGVFLEYGDGVDGGRPILHATSEGRAGGLAPNLTAFLGMMMAIPFWRDLLQFSGGGKLSEMRKTAKFMEQEFDKVFPELPDVRRRIMESMPIPIPGDPILELHESIQGTDCTLVAEDGWHYEPLFNTFTSSDNPSWR